MNTAEPQCQLSAELAVAINKVTVWLPVSSVKHGGARKEWRDVWVTCRDPGADAAAAM